MQGNTYYNNAPVQGNMKGFAKINTRAGSKLVATGDKLVNDNGEINAYNKEDLSRVISAIAQMTQDGQITNTTQDQNVILDEKMESLHTVQAAFKSNDREGMEICAEVYGDSVWETMNREGWASQVLQRADIATGTEARFRVRRKDVTTFQVMNSGGAYEQRVHQDYIFPQEYSLTTRILIDNAELAQAGPDFLDEKYQDGLEATMVKQDRICRNLFLATEGVFNTSIAYSTFTPQTLTALKTQVTSNGLTAAHMLMAVDLWDDMIADASFAAFWEPVHKYELIMQGHLGSVLNMKIITDGFRYAKLKVLNPGEVFVLASPPALGIRGVRQELSATEINSYASGSGKRGWFLEAIESMHIQDRGVAIGRRI